MAKGIKLDAERSFVVPIYEVVSGRGLNIKFTPGNVPHEEKIYDFASQGKIAVAQRFPAGYEARVYEITHVKINWDCLTASEKAAGSLIVKAALNPSHSAFEDIQGNVTILFDKFVPAHLKPISANVG